jgi:pimeloyl-ACP methyl ester carboxylesterase
VRKDSQFIPFKTEFGLKEGQPLIFFHGFPGSHLQGVVLDKAAQKLGLRVLSYDRPGYGHSKPLRVGKLNDFILGLERSLDELSIERFFLVGVSGGNPGAMVAAKYFGPRVIALGGICGLAPYREAASCYTPFTRRGLDLARKTPEPLFGILINQFLKGFKPDTQLEKMLKNLSPPDQRALRDPTIRETLLESMKMARIQGSPGISFDLKSFVSPWSSEIQKIKCPYFIWHGLQDHILPPAMAEYLHHQLPHSQLKLFPGEGHYSLPVYRSEEILSDLVSSV